jgi:HEAT repeat protein
LPGGSLLTPEFMDRVHSEDPAKRRQALQQIAAEATNPPALPVAVPVTLELLADPDPEIKRAAVQTLGTLSKRPPTEGPNVNAPIVLDLLREALKAEQPQKRVLAALGLGHLGIQDDKVRDELVKRLSDEDARARLVAALALKRVQRSPLIDPPDPTLFTAMDFAGQWKRSALYGLTLPTDSAVVPPLIAGLEDSDDTVRAWAAEELGALAGTVRAAGDAVPALTKVFEGKSPEAGQAAGLALGKLGRSDPAVCELILKALSSDDADRRQRGTNGLAGLIAPGPAAATVPAALKSPRGLEALGKLLATGDEVGRAQAALTLARIGPDAAPAIDALLKATRDEKAPVRRGAVAALGSIGKEGPRVMPALLSALADPTPEVRQAAAESLAGFGNEGLAAMRTGLADVRPEARAAAAYALGKLGPKALPAADDLRKGLKDGDGLVRVACARALWQVERKAEEAIGLLRLALKDPSAEVRRQAAETLGLIGPAAAPAVTELAATLEDSDKSVAGRAAEALAALGPLAAPATASLLRVVEQTPATRRSQPTLLNSPEFLSQKAVEALRSIGPAAVGAGPALVKVLQQGPDLEAAEALALIEPERHEGEATLLQALKGYENEREQALRALARLDKLPAEALPALIDRLGAEAGWTAVKDVLVRQGPAATPALVKAAADPGKRANALDVLGRMGADAKDALPTLKEALADPVYRQVAALALSRMGATGLPTLKEALAQPDQRLDAIRALGAMGPASAPAVGALIEALKGASPSEEAAVLEVLGRIGPAAREAALKAVSERLKAESEAVRVAAARAMVEMHAIGSEKDDTVVPLLRKLLKEGKPETKLQAAAALAHAGMLGRAAVPDLLAAFGEGEPAFRAQVAEALGQLCKGDLDTITALKAALNDREPQVARAATVALGHCYGGTEEIASALRKEIDRGGEPDLQAARAVALWRTLNKDGKKFEDVVPLLVNLLSSEGLSEEVEVLQALASIGPGAREAVVVISRRLLSPDPAVRRAATTALGRIGPPAAPTVPLLQRTAKDPSPEVRQAVQDAIKAISG